MGIVTTIIVYIIVNSSTTFFENLLEKLYFKTAAEPELEKKRAMSSSSSNAALSNNRAQAQSKSHALDKWTLMTRAHFTEALVATALDLKFGESVDLALRALLEGPVNEYWDNISSKYLQYTCQDPALKQSVSLNLILMQMKTFN